MVKKSEFGKGLVICLVKFAEHSMKLVHDMELYKEMEDRHQDGLFSISSCIKTYRNVASDHLYEIQVPKGKEWNDIRIKVKYLQEKGLKIGHGFTEPQEWTRDDAHELYQLGRDIAVMIDRMLGLKPDIGPW